MFELVKEKLMTELEITSMGNNRLFKFVNSILKDIDLTKQFLQTEGYAKWEVNKIEYSINYRKMRYQLSKLN